MKFKELEVTFIPDPSNPNIHIQDSYMIKPKTEIRAFLKDLRDTDEYKDFVANTNYSRGFNGQVNEWAAHNFLFFHNYKPDHTASVDLDQNESPVRKLAYAILSIFYRY